MPPVQPVLTSQQSHLVRADQLAQQIAVDRGMTGQNGAPKQVENVRLDADQALLGAGDLGGVAGEEMVHRLRRRELGDRRHDAEGVGGEQDDVARMAGAAGPRGVGNEVERIGGARVLGL